MPKLELNTVPHTWQHSALHEHVVHVVTTTTTSWVVTIKGSVDYTPSSPTLFERERQ